MIEDIIDHVIAAQSAAREGKYPHEILTLLGARVKPSWPGHIPYIEIELCFRHAFDIPLRQARDIEMWKGLNERGDLTDQEVDALFEPWIKRYLEHNK